VLPKKWTIKWTEGTGGAGAIMSCGGCNQVPQLYDDIKAGVPADDDATLAKLAKYCEHSLLYMGHMLRCCVQQAHINALMASLHDNPTHVHLVVDYKVGELVGWGSSLQTLLSTCCVCILRVQQKLEEMRHRATQEQYYGKRGMSYHGTAVFVSRRAVSAACAVDHLVPDGNTYQTYFFDDIVRNSQQQDTMAAMSLMEAAVMRVRTMFPEAETISFQSDNGAAYASPFLLFMIPALTAKHGLRATEFIHSEAGDGKTVLDGHFGIQTFMMKASVCRGACGCLDVGGTNTRARSTCSSLCVCLLGRVRRTLTEAGTSRPPRWWSRPCCPAPSATPWWPWWTSTPSGWRLWPRSWPVLQSLGPRPFGTPCTTPTVLAWGVTAPSPRHPSSPRPTSTVCSQPHLTVWTTCPP